jgi:SNF2 family DNA or RNA helicase
MTTPVDCYQRAVRTLKGRLISPYQHEGVAWLLDRETTPKGPCGGMLCDEMGLGKTIQLISAILGNPGGRTLVVCPKSVVGQWASELEKFAPTLTVQIHQGVDRTTDYRELTADVTITSYGCCVVKSTKANPIGKGDILPTVLHSVPWKRIILDEAHEVREKKAKVTQSVKRLAGEIKWAVTGTPVFNSMKDFVSLAEFVGLSSKTVECFPQKVRHKYVLRRTKQDLAHLNTRLDLPPCDFENVELDMNPDEERLYQDVFTEGRDYIREVMASAGNANLHTMEFLARLLRVRQVMAHPQLYLDSEQKGEKWDTETAKMRWMFQEMKNHPKEKTLIFAQFIGELDYCQNRLEAQGTSVFRIDGGVSQQGRDYQVAQFRAAAPGAVMVVQIKAGGVGLNLQEATRVYITAPSWNPATELQAIGRAHRTGQVHKVVVRKLIYNQKEGVYNSVEQSMMALQGAKAVVSSEVLNDPRLAKAIPGARESSGVTIRQIRQIFSV